MAFCSKLVRSFSFALAHFWLVIVWPRLHFFALRSSHADANISSCCRGDLCVSCMVGGGFMQALPFYVLYYFIHHIPARTWGKKGLMGWPGATCIIGNPQVGWNASCQKRCSILGRWTSAELAAYDWRNFVYCNFFTTEPEAAPSDR